MPVSIVVPGMFDQTPVHSDGLPGLGSVVEEVLGLLSGLTLLERRG